MKKLLSLLLSATMMFSLASCGNKVEKSDAEEIKVGFIFLHDENSTYDKNFMDAATAATEKLGLSAEQVMIKTNIPETADCYEAAADHSRSVLQSR